MARDDEHFRLRIPSDVKAWIAAESAKNLRSQTAEIVFLLKQAMARTEQPTT